VFVRAASGSVRIRPKENSGVLAKDNRKQESARKGGAEAKVDFSSRLHMCRYEYYVSIRSSCAHTPVIRPDEPFHPCKDRIYASGHGLTSGNEDARIEMA